MSLYWNEKTRLIIPYVPGEQPRDRKFIKLNTNENPYPPSPLVIEAIQRAAGDSLRLYPDPACTEFREAVAGRFGVNAGQVFAGNGSDEILAFAFAAFFGKNKASGKTPITSGQDGKPALSETALLFPDITYSFYPVYANLWEIPYKTIPLNEDFSMDISTYINAISNGESDGVIFPNPNAPTGIAISLQEIERTAGAAEKQKQVLVVDEAYIAFSGTEGITTAIPLIKKFPNLLIIRTLSKEVSLAGLRAGFAVGSEELTEGLCRIRDCFNSYTMDRLAIAGAVAAIKDVSYYDEINRRVIATRRGVSEGLKTLGFTVLPSEANFLFASPPAACGKSALDFFNALRGHGFLVRHFNKPKISNYLRISMGTGEDMEAFLETCRIILNRE